MPLRLFRGTLAGIRTRDLPLRSIRKYSFKKSKQLLNFSYIHWFFLKTAYLIKLFIMSRFTLVCKVSMCEKCVKVRNLFTHFCVYPMRSVKAGIPFYSISYTLLLHCLLLPYYRLSIHLHYSQICKSLIIVKNSNCPPSSYRYPSFFSKRTAPPNRQTASLFFSYGVTSRNKQSFENGSHSHVLLFVFLRK